MSLRTEQFIGGKKEYETSPDLYRLPAYPYRQLVGHDIRLFLILPGLGRLECLVHQMPLSKDVMYYALSYAWGDTNETREIYIDNQSFHVTKNLYEAMQHLRSKYDPDDYFWIDAICMNQNDIEEKALQIPRMMEIYHSALKVIVWLGPNRTANHPGQKSSTKVTDPSKLLHRNDLCRDDAVALLFEKAGSLWSEWELPEDFEAEEPVLRSVFGELYPAVVQAASELLLRPWFRRVWTVQECSLEASTGVMAGYHEVYLDRFTKLIMVLMHHHRLLAMNPGTARIQAVKQLGHKWRRDGLNYQGERVEMDTAHCLLDILTQVGCAEATDPRDHLYGILSLVQYFARDELPKELQPNYCLPFEHVYWNYAAYLLEMTGDLRLLQVSRRRILEGVPSWVPDFRFLKLRHAYGCSESIVGVSDDKRLMFSLGIQMAPLCDHVGQWDNPSNYANGVPPGLHYRIRHVEGRMFKPASQIRSVSLDSIVDDFFEKSRKLFPQGAEKGMRKVYTDLRGHSDRHGTWFSQKRRARTMDRFGKEYSIALELCQPLLMLEDGTIISVRRESVDIAVGDVVCIFKGATVPVLLRPSEHGDRYTLLGHCAVVSGTFHQEEFDHSFWEGRQLEKFWLE